MICPKCKSENQFGIFCSECGNQLKEKCPECGKMEPIGRKVCETKLEEAQRERYKFVAPRIRDLPDDSIYAPIATISIIIIAILVIAGGAFIVSGFSLFFFQLPVPDLERNRMALNFEIFGILILVVSRLIYVFANKYFVKNIKKMELDKQKATQKFLQENPVYAEILREAEGKE